MSWVRSVIVALALALAGCASTPPPAPARPMPNAPARIEEPTFVLELQQDDDARVSLTLEGRGGYHVNLDFPLRVDLEASAAQLAKPRLERADAIEVSEARARFDLPVQWNAAGEQWLAARVQFAVCTPDTCVPDQRELAITVRVR